MLNYEGIAKIAVDKIIADMKERMMGENYCIHNVTITVDIENRTMTVECMRKDPIGIEYKASKTVEI